MIKFRDMKAGKVNGTPQEKWYGIRICGGYLHYTNENRWTLIKHDIYKWLAIHFLAKADKLVDKMVTEDCIRKREENWGKVYKLVEKKEKQQ